MSLGAQVVRGKVSDLNRGVQGFESTLLSDDLGLVLKKKDKEKNKSLT